LSDNLVPVTQFYLYYMVFYYLVSLGPSYHLTQLSGLTKGRSRKVDYSIGVYLLGQTDTPNQRVQIHIQYESNRNQRIHSTNHVSINLNNQSIQTITKTR